MALDAIAGPLIDPDEGRYAAIPAAMVRSGDWILPRLNGLPYAEKPPLAYWLTAISMQFFGRHELSARLPAAMMTLVTALLVGRLARGAFGSTAGFCATLIYASSPLALLLARTPLPDLPLALGVSIALGAVLARVLGSLRTELDLIAWLGVATGFLAKGPIAIVLIGLPIALSGPVVWRGAARLLTPRAIGLAILLVAPWFVAIGWRVAGFTQFFFWHEHVERFLGSQERGSHGVDWLTWIALSLALSAPWGFLVPGKAAKRDLALAQKASVRFLWAWALTPFLIFLPSQSRLATYLLPGLSGFSILAGLGLAKRLDFSHRDIAWILVRWLVALLALALAAGAVFLSWRGNPLETLVDGEMLEQLRDPTPTLVLLCASAAALMAFRVCRVPCLKGVAATAFALWAASVAGSLLAARLAPFFGCAGIVKDLERIGNAPVISVARLRQSLEFYLDRPPYQFSGFGELKFGSQFDEKGLLLKDRSEVDAIVKRYGEAYLVLSEVRLGKVESALDRKLERVGGGARHTLYRISSPATSNQPR